MLKGATVAYCKVLFQYLPGETEEIHKIFSYGGRCPGRYSKPAPPEHKSEALSHKPIFVMGFIKGRAFLASCNCFSVITLLHGVS
jgi:hypothetical protein